MAEFDPYLKWLGIRETTRPINHYRLLGLELFEKDKDVISMAADRQMAHIRTYQSGPNGKLSQQILNELSRARRCLLVDEKKEEYDQELRRLIQASAPAAPPVVGAPSVAEVAPMIVDSPPVGPMIDTGKGPSQGVPNPNFGSGGVAIKSDPDARAKTKTREKKQLVWTLVSWLSGAIAAVVVGGYLVTSGILGNKPLPDPDKPDIIAKKKDDKTDSNNGSSLNLNKTNGKANLVDNPAPKTNVDSNLAQISGIGQRSEADLQANGVKTIEQLAKMSPSEVGNVLTKAGRTGADKFDEYTGWIGQAKKLVGDTTPIKSDDSTTSSTASTNFSSTAVGVPPVAWTASTLREYPRASSDTVELLDSVQRFIGQKRISKLGVSGALTRATASKSGVEEQIIGLGHRSVVVGIGYETNSDLTIKTLRPIYRSKASLKWPGDVGPMIETSKIVIGDPGYAVGEVQVSVLDPINCFRVRFMKMTPAGLDSNDSYFSSWQGREVGPVTTIGNEQNVPVVGFYCFATEEEQVHTLGLIGASAEFAPFNIRPTKISDPSSIFTQGDPGAAENSNSVAAKTTEAARLVAKVAKPSASLRSSAKKEIEKLYGDLIEKSQKKFATDNRRRADRLISDAIKIEDDPARQYVLLELAQELAMLRGDAKTALSATRGLSQRFEDYDFWDQAEDIVKDSGKVLLTTGNQQMASDLEASLVNLIDEAIDSGEARAAEGLIKWGKKNAARTGDSRALDYYSRKEKLSKELSRIANQNSSALRKLATDPTNEDANMNRGRYFLVVEKDIPKALECWEKCGDKKYTDLVAYQKGTEVDPKKHANYWRDLAGKDKTLFDKSCYRQAISVLEEVPGSKYKTEIRLLRRSLED